MHRGWDDRELLFKTDATVQPLFIVDDRFGGTSTWVVVKIMVPFWVLHTQKGTLILTTTHMNPEASEEGDLLLKRGACSKHLSSSFLLEAHVRNRVGSCCTGLQAQGLGISETTNRSCFLVAVAVMCFGRTCWFTDL